MTSIDPRRDADLKVAHPNGERHAARRWVALAVVGLTLLLPVQAYSQPELQLFLPAIAAAYPTNLILSGWEVTQAVQTAANSVTLVKDRPTVVRLYASSQTENPVPWVSLLLEGSRDGVPLPGSPLTSGPLALSPVSTRDVYTSSVNVPLPAEWVRGQVVLTATVDSTGVVAGSNEIDNRAVWSSTFVPVPPLSLVLVPIRYTDPISGTVFAAPTVDTITPLVLRILPLSNVRTTLHSAIDSSENLMGMEGWLRLMQQVVAIKHAEGAPQTTVYLGVLPLGIPAAYGGYGQFWDRAALTLDQAGWTPVHEIGHTFGRNHVDCGGAAVLDPNYPYAQGVIGQFGLDLTTNQVFTPAAHDLMSYCQEWISDYTYLAMMKDQIQRVPLADAALAQSRLGDGLLIRINLTADGVIDVLPFYRLYGRLLPLSETGDFAIDLLDTSGEVVATYALDANVAVGTAGSAHLITALVPYPSTSVVTRIRLRHGERVLAEHGWQDGTPIADRDAPVLVRLRSPDGASGSVVCIDVALADCHPWVSQTAPDRLDVIPTIDRGDLLSSRPVSSQFAAGLRRFSADTVTRPHRRQNDHRRWPALDPQDRAGRA